MSLPGPLSQGRRAPGGGVVAVDAEGRDWQAVGGVQVAVPVPVDLHDAARRRAGHCHHTAVDVLCELCVVRDKQRGA